MLLLAFSVYLGWFPVVSDPDMDNWGERIHMLILPAMNLGLIMMAYVVRSARSSMLETLGEDYIRTAKAKGLPEFIILYKHGLKNALIPVITIIGLYLDPPKHAAVFSLDEKSHIQALDRLDPVLPLI